MNTQQSTELSISPGTFGHGSAYGTQAWIDPVKEVFYALLVQRSDFPNADDPEVRRAFQTAAAEAMGNGAYGSTLIR